MLSVDRAELVAISSFDAESDSIAGGGSTCTEFGIDFRDYGNGD